MAQNDVWLNKSQLKKCNSLDEVLRLVAQGDMGLMLHLLALRDRLGLEWQLRSLRTAIKTVDGSRASLATYIDELTQALNSTNI